MDAGMHHHATQLCVGLGGPLRLRSGEDLKWVEHQGFYVPPDEPHEFIATATSKAIVHVEAESAEFAALQALSQGAAAIRATAPPVFYHRGVAAARSHRGLRRTS